jgi:hypothetical protein
MKFLFNTEKISNQTELIHVGFLGNFTEKLPHKNSTNLFLEFLDQYVTLGVLNVNYKIYVFKNGTSAGMRFYELIQTWDHWGGEK